MLKLCRSPIGLIAFSRFWTIEIVWILWIIAIILWKHLNSLNGLELLDKNWTKKVFNEYYSKSLFVKNFWFRYFHHLCFQWTYAFDEIMKSHALVKATFSSLKSVHYEVRSWARSLNRNQVDLKEQVNFFSKNFSIEKKKLQRSAISQFIRQSFVCCNTMPDRKSVRSFRRPDEFANSFVIFNV